MKVSRKMDDAESREYWEFVERTAREVETWPTWMRGGDNVGQFREDRHLVVAKHMTEEEAPPPKNRRK